MSFSIKSVAVILGLAAFALAQALPLDARAQDAEALLNAKCSSCHKPLADGGIHRINEARKTPEGWFMTLFRMTNIHGVKLTSDETRTLVTYLSNTQGLAPAETEGYRYVLERTPGAIDGAPNENLGAMCGRCHTFARVALQRRDTDDWRKLVHFHLGQYPTTEYQALGRDRDWFGLASDNMATELGRTQPLDTPDWATWKDRAPTDLSGIWIVVGRQPGKGAYDGSMQVTASGDDTYDAILAIQFADGQTAEHKGTAIVYTGHEWRASKLGPDGPVRQVLGASEDGGMLTGRWFLRDNDVIGGSMKAVRVAGAEPQILAVNPPYIKQGGSVQVTIIGLGMDGEPQLGAGVTVKNIIAQTSEKIVAEIEAAADAAVGPRGVSAGEANAPDSFVVYDKVDRVAVLPETTIARVGDGGGPIASVPAQFEAMGFMAGPDGEGGTDDDIAIGVMPATWSTSNFDATAEMLKDTEFAGTIDQGGLFSPGIAGPNPARPMSTNNAGNLNVVATVDDDGNPVEGAAHLFVTVQRYIDPPIR
ncbi:MAG: quinohemoprotein amine dehydrogenase subunit alpha [Alphaproteobacteria bacterium]|nr:quinohemoprotein amine dehydrogenase subunit alpha [Alphaproteobacteria bacterium]